MGIAARLDAALRLAGVPIDSVSIGRKEDRSTWWVHPASLQAQAQPVIDAYADPTPNTLLDQFADVRISDPALKAWAKAVYEAIPGTPTRTWDNTRARAKAIFKQQP